VRSAGPIAAEFDLSQLNQTRICHELKNDHLSGDVLSRTVHPARVEVLYIGFSNCQVLEVLENRGGFLSSIATHPSGQVSSSLLWRRENFHGPCL
jgi:hypothetical protein